MPKQDPRLAEFEALDAEVQRRDMDWYDKLEPEQREKVDAAWSAGHGAVTIARVVTSWGRPISDVSVRRHFVKARLTHG